MKVFLNQPYSFIQIGGKENQEDARCPDDDQPSPDQLFYVLCDGVGGQTKGEIASRTVTSALAEYMVDEDLDKPFSASDFKKALEFAYCKLYGAMSKYHNKDMATTLVFLCFHEKGVTMAHMGDSRIYQIRLNVGIIYKSNDHSLVNALVKSGELTPQEAINHKHSNYITRCVCYVDPQSSVPSADLLQSQDILPGDYFFLCTDGVYSQISDEELLMIIRSSSSDKEKTDRISQLSKDSSDNNTAFLISIKEVLQDSYFGEKVCGLGSSPGTQTLSEMEDVIIEVTPDIKQTLWNKLKLILSNLF